MRRGKIGSFIPTALANGISRGIHDLMPYVIDDEYDRLINFMYLETKEAVDEFSAWIKTLDNLKVQGLSIKFAFSSKT
jgi:hypothetical protein